MRLESPQKLGGPFFVDDHGHEVLVIPDRPKATVRIAIHAEHHRLLLRLGRRTRPPPGCTATFPCSSVVRWPASGCTTCLWHCCAAPSPPDAAHTSLPGSAGGVAAGAWLWRAPGRCWGAAGPPGPAARPAGSGPAGRRVAWRGGCGTAVGACGRGLALLAEGVEVGLPLPCLVEHILDPGHQVLHAAGQLRIAHVAHRVEDFDIAHAEPQATAGRGFVDVPAVGAGEPLLAGVLCGGWCGCWRCFSTGRRRRASGGFRWPWGCWLGPCCRAGPVPGGAARPPGVCLQSSARCVASAQGQSGARR